MKPKEKEEQKPEQQQEPPKEETAVAKKEDGLDYKAMFSRDTNGNKPIRSIRLGRILTKPLIAAAHFKGLLFECTSEMYTMSLPAKGRGGKPTTARVIDGVNIETGDEVTLIVSEMIAGAWKRDGYKVLSSHVNADEETEYLQVDGQLLIGHTFALKSGSINEEKGYRVVDVREVFVDR